MMYDNHDWNGGGCVRWSVVGSCGVWLVQWLVLSSLYYYYCHYVEIMIKIIIYDYCVESTL